MGRQTPSSPRSHHTTHNSPRSPEHDIGTRLNHLAETWGLPSLSRLACTLLLQALQCKIIQRPRTPLLDVRPRGRNQNNPARYCIAYCINHIELGTTQHLHYLVPGRREWTPTTPHACAGLVRDSLVYCGDGMCRELNLNTVQIIGA